MTGWSPAETMIVASARRLAGHEVCFVGIGLPNVAAALARRTVAPDLELLFESGAIGVQTASLPISIGDPVLVSGARAVSSMFELFAYYLHAGRVDLGFLGAAQIDRFGSLNTTVVGPYGSPDVRLPGSGGAAEISLYAGEVLVIMRHRPRAFVAELDFCTSAGSPPPIRDMRAASSRYGRGPTIVVTDLGVLEYDDDAEELILTGLQPGVSVEAVVANTGWDLRVAPEVGVLEPPTTGELRLIRQELDPDGIYTGTKDQR